MFWTLSFMQRGERTLKSPQVSYHLDKDKDKMGLGQDLGKQIRETQGLFGI